MKRNGFTLIEIVITLAIAGIIAAGAAGILVPQINSYLNIVGGTTVQAAASDALKIIIEGDQHARGLRFADPTQPILSASGNTLVYRYYDLDQVAADTPHQVTVVYNAAQHVVSRVIDSGSVDYLPHYAQPNGPIALDALESNFFRYYDSAGTELTGAITPADVDRVTIGLTAAYASGDPRRGGSAIQLKSGAFIKRNA